MLLTPSPWIAALCLLGTALAQTTADTEDPKKLPCKVVKTFGTSSVLLEVHNRGKKPVEPMTFVVVGQDAVTEVVERAPWPFTGRLGRPIPAGGKRQYFLPVPVPQGKSAPSWSVGYAAIVEGAIKTDDEPPVVVHTKGAAPAPAGAALGARARPQFELENTTEFPQDIVLRCALLAQKDGVRLKTLRLAPHERVEFHPDTRCDPRLARDDYGGQDDAGGYEAVLVVDWCALVHGGRERAKALLAKATPPFDMDKLQLIEPGQKVGIRRTKGAQQHLNEGQVERDENGRLVVKGAGGDKTTLSPLEDLLELLDGIAGSVRQDGPDLSLATLHGAKAVLSLERPGLRLFDIHTFAWFELDDGRPVALLPECAWDRQGQRVEWTVDPKLPGSPPTKVRVITQISRLPDQPYITFSLDWKAARDRSVLARVHRVNDYAAAISAETWLWTVEPK